MGLKKLAAKMAEYNDRLNDGKAKAIKPNHVEKILGKLRDKETELTARIAETDNQEKRQRLSRKLTVAREQISRGEWLLDHVSRASEDRTESLPSSI